MSYLLGIDLGTTSTRALIIDEQGAPVVSHAVEHRSQPRAPTGRSRTRATGGGRPSRACARR